MDPFEEVAEARDLLKNALALFDGSNHDDAEAPGAMARVTAGLSTLRDPAALRREVPEAERERFDDELEELLRLNAVLVEAIRLDQEELVRRLRTVRTSQRDLSYHGAVASSGSRCDVSG